MTLERRILQSVMNDLQLLYDLCNLYVPVAGGRVNVLYNLVIAASFFECFKSVVSVAPPAKRQ